MPKGRVRIGVGGWTYEPWRGGFYPTGLAHKEELAFASRKLSSIEVNGTYYRTQTPDTFSKWHDETPDDFVFALKAPRYVTNRRVLAEGQASIERFFASGVMRLGAKLGPVNWQFMPTKTFDPVDFEGFLKLLPSSVEGRRVRHAVEVRHESFRAPEFVALAREYGVAIVVAGDSEYPLISDVTSGLVYVRIMGTSEGEALGYSAQTLDRWAERALVWASGGSPEGFGSQRPDGTRDVFLYVISGFKERNPAAAMALIERVDRAGGSSGPGSGGFD